MRSGPRPFPTYRLSTRSPCHALAASWWPVRARRRPIHGGPCTRRQATRRRPVHTQRPSPPQPARAGGPPPAMLRDEPSADLQTSRPRGDAGDHLPFGAFNSARKWPVGSLFRGPPASPSAPVARMPPRPPHPTPTRHGRPDPVPPQPARHTNPVPPQPARHTNPVPPAASPHLRPQCRLPQTPHQPRPAGGQPATQTRPAGGRPATPTPSRRRPAHTSDPSAVFLRPHRVVGRVGWAAPTAAGLLEAEGHRNRTEELRDEHRNALIELPLCRSGGLR